MLKKRIIPVQTLLDGRLVKTLGFGEYRDVGDPVKSSKVYSSQNADELVFLNIARGVDRQAGGVDVLLRLIDRVTEECFMPLSLGGGIRTLADVDQLFQHGADKVVVNSAAYREPALLSAIAGKYGAQALVVSIDARREPADVTGLGAVTLHSSCGRVAEPVSLEDHVRAVVAAGAGEIFVNSIDRDGTMSGYDVELIAATMAAVARATEGASPVPVIACGGAGKFMDMKEAFERTGVSALACGSLFNFGDNNPIRAKAFLSNYGLAFKKV